MTIIETDTIKQARDVIADTITSGIDALPLDKIDLPDVSDVTDSITHVASVAASKGSKGAFRTYRTVTKTVRNHPKGSGLTLVALVAVVGVLVWWSRRTSAEEPTLEVARAA